MGAAGGTRLTTTVGNPWKAMPDMLMVAPTTAAPRRRHQQGGDSDRRQNGDEDDTQIAKRRPEDPHRGRGGAKPPDAPRREDHLPVSHGGHGPRPAKTVRAREAKPPRRRRLPMMELKRLNEDDERGDDEIGDDERQRRWQDGQKDERRPTSTTIVTMIHTD